MIPWLKDRSKWREQWLKLPRPRRGGLVGLIIALGAILLYLLYSLLYLGQIYPRVSIGPHSFGGQTADEARVQLQSLNTRLEAEPVRVNYQGKTIEFDPNEVEWQLDTAATLERLIGYGRQARWWRSAFQQLAAPLHRPQIKPVVSFNEASLDEAIGRFAELNDEPAIDAGAKIVNGAVQATGEASGRRLNRIALKSRVVVAWSAFAPTTLVVEGEIDRSRVVLGDATILQVQVDELLKTGLVLTWPGREKRLKPNEISQLIGFVGEEEPLGSPEASANLLSAKFTVEAIKNYLFSIATETDQPAREPKLVIRSGQLQIAASAQVGTVVDRTASASAILAALNIRSQPATVGLSFKTQEPIIKESNLASLGIRELIGRGETSFVGSPANRKFNIGNGVSVLQSALVKPNEEFSTVKTLGQVDGSTGYLPELVIKENKTTPEFGGGLCQVSTTLFRAILNSGLKVTERQNHSYRVSYYEPPIGLDATIYLPKPDLKFLNDTPGHILVQGRVEGNKVIFEFWGTKDGREVVISAPIVSNIKEPGEPIYADTDTLPKGEQKQIEKPHAGATAIVTYSVKRNGREINKQVFKSIYKVWPARFLVGTNESLLPPPPAL